MNMDGPMIAEKDVQDAKATCLEELKNPQYDKNWIGKRNVSLQLLTVIGIIDELLERRGIGRMTN